MQKTFMLFVILVTFVYAYSKLFPDLTGNMNTKKKIEVNSSSLVGLKAELFRKQEALRKERLQQNSTTVRAKPAQKKPSIWNKKNAGVQSRAEKDKSLTAEEENQLVKSRAALEAKTKLYEQMSQRTVLSADDDVSDRFLVDFEKKAIDDLKEEKRRLEDDDEDKKTEYEMGSTDVPGPVHPEEEWVDYVDTLGRSRRCMKKDLPELIDMDKCLNPQAFKKKEEKDASRESLPDLLSSDMYREMMRKKWEEEEEEMRRKGPGSVHYQNVRFDEVREMGVGYFDFSKDENERQKQMEMLKHLRDKTIDQRGKSEQLKAKRKAALRARLEKVKQRKRLKGEFVDDEVEQKEELGETKEEEEEGLRRREEDVKRLVERINKTAPVRPWDIGKDESKWERVKRQVREERPQEFAPPGYYDGTAEPSRNDQRFTKKSDFAPPASCIRPKQQPCVSNEFVPPKDYGYSGSHGTFKESGGEMPSGKSFEPMPAPEYDRMDGASVSGRLGTEDLSGRTGQRVVNDDSIAQALSFFRQNVEK